MNGYEPSLNRLFILSYQRMWQTDFGALYLILNDVTKKGMVFQRRFWIQTNDNKVWYKKKEDMKKGRKMSYLEGYLSKLHRTLHKRVTKFHCLRLVLIKYRVYHFRNRNTSLYITINFSRINFHAESRTKNASLIIKNVKPSGPEQFRLEWHPHAKQFSTSVGKLRVKIFCPHATPQLIPQPE